MITISNIKDKINSSLNSSKALIMTHVLIVLFLMVSSFLLGKISEKSVPRVAEKGMQIYLPNGELLTQSTSEAAQSQLSAYILGGAEASVIPQNGPDIHERIQQIDMMDTQNLTDSPKIAIFGSKNGSTYYIPGCKSGDRVKIENRIYFESESDAEDQGYSRSKLCK